MKRSVRGWHIEAGVLILWTLLAVIEATDAYLSGYTSPKPWVIAFMLIGAAALVRRVPWLSLLILWAVLLVEWRLLADFMLVDFIVVYVLFGLARWGSTAVVWASAFSLPLAMIALLSTLGQFVGNFWHTRVVRTVVINLVNIDQNWETFGAIALLSMLFVPWLAGLAMRFLHMSVWARAGRDAAEVENRLASFGQAQMREMAQLRQRQSDLARDVHDVVGHSLAVILSQAESGQYISGDDEAAHKAILKNIATTSRQSLQEIRGVLTTMKQESSQLDPEHLIEACRSAGVDVEVNDVGRPKAITAEASETVYRVLQELLTNAIKYGEPRSPIMVVREWNDGLSLRVSNVVSPDRSKTQGTFQGLVGVQERAEAMGGTVTIDPGGPRFTVTIDFPDRVLSKKH